MIKAKIEATLLDLDPLEQFEVLYYKCIFFSNLHYYVGLVCFGLVFLLFFNGGFVGYSKRKPNVVLFRDRTFTFLRSIMKENRVKTLLLLVRQGIRYFSFFFFCGYIFSIIMYSDLFLIKLNYAEIRLPGLAFKGYVVIY
jgi:hypothetical protein